MTDILLDSTTDWLAARPNPSDGALQVVDLVELLPRRPTSVVAVRGGLCVDGAQETQVADDGLRRPAIDEVEVANHRRL